MERFAIGLDFGSLSARALIVNVENGDEIACASADYAHGVMERELPGGQKLPKDYALQDPRDYLAALRQIVPSAMRQAGIAPERVIGIGLDATSSTVLPVLADGTPLCCLPEYAGEPHAYAKLWKHHAAQPYATRMTDGAQGEAWVGEIGGKISAEWALPKFWQVYREAPEIYRKMAYFMEASDWLVWQLTGNAAANACSAGYKTLYRPGAGYPSDAYFAGLEKGLERAIREKYTLPIRAPWERAGGLKTEWAREMGLCPGTAVAIGGIDGHSCVPAVGIIEPGWMLAIIGTSAGHMLLSPRKIAVPGICGVVEGGLMPGMAGYEAGQNAVGDHFAWLVENLCPAEVQKAAKERGLGLHEYLTDLASRLRPGESGLIALDWWNGSRSILMDADLTGLLIGMTLQTKCEEIYRALIEATAYGTRLIVENYRRHGVPVEGFIAGGGIAKKNAMMMQIYADVMNMPVHIAKSRQCSALGSAIFGAVAAGGAKGGWDSVVQAAQAMGGVSETVYSPIPKNAAVYDQLYREYRALHDLFGRGGSDVMKRLKQIRKQAVSAQV